MEIVHHADVHEIRERFDFVAAAIVFLDKSGADIKNAWLFFDILCPDHLGQIVVTGFDPVLFFLIKGADLFHELVVEINEKKLAFFQWVVCGELDARSRKIFSENKIFTRTILVEMHDLT